MLRRCIEVLPDWSELPPGKRVTLDSDLENSTMSLQLTHDAATQVWDDLATRIEHFLQDWDRGDPPVIGNYLPSEPPALRRLVLVELVKVDMEQRSTRRLLRSLEAYAAEHPELLEKGEPPCDLIYEEYHIRKQAGENVSPRTYYERFPRSSEALRRLLGAEDLSASTQLFSAKQVQGVEVGQRLDDFDLMMELGKGAFGSVFLARQVSMRRLVALKISADKGNEPQTLATMEHPHIVRVYDQRTLPDRRVRLLYMQFAPGGTLQEVICRLRETPSTAWSGRLLVETVTDATERTGTAMIDDSPARRRMLSASWPETVCKIGVQLALALDYAHHQGILHRDVKPANILLSADCSPKLADFNISFCSQLEGATPAAYFGGSLAYMSPEQLEACNPAHSRRPDELDGRSDLFSLAVVLWEMLFGQRPFHDVQLEEGWTATLVEMTRRRQSDPPEYPKALANDPLTRRMMAVLQRALSHDRDDRHADCEELARDLSLCLNPSAWDLLKETGRGWHKYLLRNPMVWLVPINLTPFIIAGRCNYTFNSTVIIKELAKRGDSAGIEQRFEFIAFLINGSFFPLGMLLILFCHWPVMQAVKRISRRQECPPDLRTRARKRVFWVGHAVAGIGIALWIIAGIAFPVSLRLSAGDLLHFIVSQTIYGLVSAGFPFMIMTALAVRVFYPTLLGSSLPTEHEQRLLLMLPQHAWISFLAAVAVPMGGVILAIWFGRQEPTASLIFLIASLLGALAAGYLYSQIRRDVAALTIATRPADSFGTVTDSVGTY